MVKRLLHKYSNRFASKELILFIDCIICIIAFNIAIFLRFNLEFQYFAPALYKYHVFLLLVVRISIFFYFKSYSGIIRHSSSEDAGILVKSITISTIILMSISTVSRLLNRFEILEIPISVLAIDYFISLFALIASRFLVKNTYEHLLRGIKIDKPVIIYGSGELGITVKNTLLRDKKNKYQVLCFIDDNTAKINKTIQGIRVLSKEEALEKYFDKEDSVQPELILAIQNIAGKQRMILTEEFLDRNITIKAIPPVTRWINGELNIKQIQQIKIEDLLEREPITINNKLVSKFLDGKKILITGAAGSIGSEIVRQLLNHNPSELLLIDQSESGLYDLETELFRVDSRDKLQNLTKIKTEVLDLTDEKILRKRVFAFKPNIIFHAAAYKHVPLMEKNPYQAVNVNVFGTKYLADIASELKVEKFVFISTDKAVNPTNVMGTTKRLAEMYVQSLNAYHSNETRFIVTRFGNVLGSNGSVIPIFKRQIEAGGPLTVTHKDIIRYFMTIPEACQLVLEAGTMGKGGEIFVFDMGEPVRIVDLAKKMIQLSGLEYGKDIEIKYTGLRPGEKLYEELLNDNENTLVTYHPKIMIAKVIPREYEHLFYELQTLKQLLKVETNMEIVTKLKMLVPEFISNNSEYEDLDDLKKEPLNT